MIGFTQASDWSMSTPTSVNNNNKKSEHRGTPKANKSSIMTFWRFYLAYYGLKFIIVWELTWNTQTVSRASHQNFSLLCHIEDLNRNISTEWLSTDNSNPLVYACLHRGHMTVKWSCDKSTSTLSFSANKCIKVRTKSKNKDMWIWELSLFY